MATIRDVFAIDDRATATLSRIEGGYRKVSLSSQDALTMASSFMEAFDHAIDSGKSFEKACEAGAKAMNAAMGEIAQTAPALNDEADAARRAADSTADVGTAAERSSGGLKSFVSALLKTNSPLDGFTNKIRRMALSLFTARRLLTYVRNALKRAPEEIATPLSAFTTTVKDTFAQIVLSVTRGLLPALQRFNQMLQSENGQRVIKALATAFDIAGQALGYLLDGVSKLINWIGSNMNTVLLAGAAILGLFAAKMLYTAAAAAVANAPMLLTVAIIGMLAAAMTGAGITAQEVFTAIGTGAGALYALLYNLVANLWNTVLAPFAEAFGTMLDNPVQGIIQLLTNLAVFALNVVQRIAAGIDAVFGSNLAGAVGNGLANLENWASNQFSSYKSLGRMEIKDVKQTAQSWGAAAGGIANKFSSTSLDAYQLSELQDINANTGATAKAVNMAEEDLRDFIDMAARDYVVRVNLATNAPNITINGQNTGNTKEDAENVAGVIARMLSSAASANSNIPTTVFTGG